MTNIISSDELSTRAHKMVSEALFAYTERRMHFYQDDVALKRLFTKDVLMFALRGVETASNFVNEAFFALESSSEETNMGTTWQNILKDLATSPAVDLSDLVVEKEGALWVIEVKSQTNTLNARSLAETVRTLKRRVDEYSRMSAVRRRAVRAMLGVIRGTSLDEQREYKLRGDPGTADVAVPYRYVVGAAFWQWLTGRPNIMALLGDFRTKGRQIAEAREACRHRLQQEMQALLAKHGLPDTINSVLTLVYGDARP